MLNKRKSAKIGHLRHNSMAWRSVFSKYRHFIHIKLYSKLEAHSFSVVTRTAITVQHLDELSQSRSSSKCRVLDGRYDGRQHATRLRYRRKRRITPRICPFNLHRQSPQTLSFVNDCLMLFALSHFVTFIHQTSGLFLSADTDTAVTHYTTIQCGSLLFGNMVISLSVQ